MERATEIARAMVMDYGMSRLGRVNYRESSRSPFLTTGGMDLGRQTLYSEQTAREIDQEVRRIVDAAIDRVRHLLETRRASLEALSKRLIEREVIDGDEMRQVVEETSPGPWIVPGTNKSRAPRPAADVAARRPAHGAARG